MKKFILCTLFFCLTLFFSIKVNATKIIIENKDITDIAKPINKNDRLLVPIRFIGEELGKEVDFIEYSREVVVKEGENKMVLKLGSNLLQLPDGTFYLSDVPADIINDRTYVPLRVIAESFNMAVNYDSSRDIVNIYSGKKNQDDSYDVYGFLPTANGILDFNVIAGKNISPRIYKTKLFVLDPITKRGFINDVNEGKTVKYVPWDTNANNILLVASFDKNGNIVAGRGRVVKTELSCDVKIIGPNKGERVKGVASITPKTNFIPKFVSYTVYDVDTNKSQKYENRDPFSPFQFEVSGGENKNVQVTMSATSLDGNNFVSEPINFNITNDRRLKLTGVKAGETLRRTINLNVDRNFDVKSTRYYIGSVNGEVLLNEKPYGSYIYNPDESINGDYYFRSEVTLPNGEVLSTERVNVNIVGGKRLLIQGIGPNAVITEPIELSYDSNVLASKVTYVFMGASNFEVSGVIGGKTPFNPDGKINGDYNVFVKIDSPTGELTSDSVKVRLYNGKIFGAVSVLEKNKVIETFSKYALDTMNKTGLASSIQLAQAILETGWAQSVPVDKYTGKVSNNLFGIKGTGPNGFVISNTWEEYNGVKYRIDDKFRAYNNLKESWDDHNILLTKDRYKIVRDVMYDSYRAVWAIKRAGYATDSKYPEKLLNIISSNNLRKYDEVSF